MWSADSLLQLLTVGFLAKIYVSAQPGFLSLDCGGYDNYTDGNGIEWTPDDKYITTGIPTSISISAKNQTDLLWQRLRYFNDTSRKHCYALPVVANQSYILRPWFYYGNYDGIETTLSQFNIIIGANDVVKFGVDLTNKVLKYYYEFVIKATSSTLDLCLGTRSNSPANIPFISAIELRRLDPGLKISSFNASELLITWRRINLGAATNHTIRYPSDDYDRIWVHDTYFPGFMGEYQRINTTSNVSLGKTLDKPPTAVMSSAITSNSTMVFQFPTKLNTTPTKFYVNFYFAEFSALVNNTREFRVLLNTSSLESPHLLATVNVEKYTQAPLTSFQMYLNSPVELTEPTNFLFVPTVNSTLGPILNAAELCEYKGGLLPGTEPNDVAAIRDVMKDFHITEWSGDPCLPDAYTWKWITCDVAQIPARIIELNLSSSGLKGTISLSITKLSHLTKIYLDNNALTGRVPDFSSLKNLTVLSLENNSLDCLPPEHVHFSYNATFSLCEKKHTTLIFEVVVPCAAILLLGAGLVVCFFSGRKTSKSITVQNRNPSLSLKSPNSSTKMIAYKDVIEATSNFKRVIGEGSFGPVYYGCLPNGVEVAVKVLSSNSKQGYQEFQTEIDILSVVHHKNLVPFLGYCTQKSKLILVYEFLSNGTLREHLYGEGKRYPTLSWKTRLGIALDAAQGLEYLHTSCNLHIIHRDVKTSNILLSFDMVAKLSDFGLSKFYDSNKASHVSTGIKGTPGYLDPEYHSYSRLTEKSDVYSFGVVLFEIVCGREPLNFTLLEEQIVLSEWACKELEKGNLRTVIDPSLSDYGENAALKVLEVARKCVERSPHRRPNMSTVVIQLREAIQLEDGSSLPKSMETFTGGR
ncbi:probable LRR receptor-like serine/threonine-protein kinase At1g67720 isoform X1 [Selaginella moellendorffii]|uniref:probable LRR receptor-like serine/threonine-protein kinase At1g67720 isoform X1 n=1 Tax=Selaginella moellendorffii TaxID=88036 RepID=UPI000D1C6F78|nr:probable LRR receptor-like serine/threonine-protein kinase At1g67720 isoform X1 [Selaginella moellendorffii]|eukprot:XP_024537474.1 probable LRR receptor-like serine/threonine-protein kinase At1g67720 isoform X1 [Selaginella moellendorffii]